MKAKDWLLVVGLGLVAAGCTKAPAPDTAGDEAKIEAALDKLTPEDRKLAEQQKFCALENDHRLGSMGVPHKATIQGETVFFCCKGCEKEARADPDKIAAKARELRGQSATPKEGP
jgi:hypothetical protein